MRVVHPWFAVQKVAAGVWLIAEPGHVNSWLVEGRDRAALLDTGLGIAPIRPVVEALTSRPVSVLNTHAHFDHIGGNREFADVTIHERGVAKLRQGVPAERFPAYLAFTRELLAGTEEYRRLDDRFFFLLDDASLPRPLPAVFRDADWTIPPSHATATVRDGDVIDLGSRRLDVLHTPGHSPDSICLLDREAGILFAGDTINTGPIYAHLPDSDLPDLAASAARLARLADGLSMICVCHFGRAVAVPALLGEVAEGLAGILDGRVRVEASADALKRPAALARFARFSVLLPPEMARPG